MVSTIIWIAIAVGVFWLIYLLIKHLNVVIESIINIAPEVAGLANKITHALDKDPNTVSPVEKVVYYAEIATKAIEQSYKKLKEEKKKALEDGKITKEELEALYKQMKEEAISIVEQLAQADGFYIDTNIKGIISAVIEAMVFFLPKSNA